MNPPSMKRVVWQQTQLHETSYQSETGWRYPSSQLLTKYPEIALTNLIQDYPNNVMIHSSILAIYVCMLKAALLV